MFERGCHPAPDREQQRVVANLARGLGMNHLLDGVDPAQAVLDQLGILIVRDLGQLVPLGATHGEGRLDAQSPKGKLVVGGEERNVHGIAGEATQPEKSLDGGDSAADDHNFKAFHEPSLGGDSGLGIRIENARCVRVSTDRSRVAGDDAQGPSKPQAGIGHGMKERLMTELVGPMKLRSTAGRKPLVLIAGGGVAALEALLALRELAGDRIALELIAPGPDFSYRPLAVGEPFGLGEARRYDLGAICSDQQARLTHGEVEVVEAEHKWVLMADGERRSYDALVVAVGAKTSPSLEQAITIYGPGYTGRFSATLEDLEQRRIHEVTFVVPEGGAWSLPIYELALMTARWAAERELEGVHLRLVTHEDRPLQLFGAAASDAVERLLDEAHVALDVGGDGRGSVYRDTRDEVRDQSAAVRDSHDDRAVLDQPADHGQEQCAAAERTVAGVAGGGVRQEAVRVGGSAGDGMGCAAARRGADSARAAGDRDLGVALYLFFRTNLGTAMRATGDNAKMIRALGVDDGLMTILGLAVSNR